MRIDDKIEEIERFLEELMSFIPSRIDDYKEDFQVKAACERYFERIIEAIIDLAFLLVKEKNFSSPESEEVVFDLLKRENIINQELCEKLKNAKGMRNILSHQYGVVNDELVFEALTTELEKDVKEFIEEVKGIIRQ